MHALCLLGIQRHHSLGVHGQRYENQLQHLCNDIKKFETQISSICQRKTLMLLEHNNARPHTNAATSAAKDTVRSQVVPHPSYSLDLSPSYFRLFVGLKKFVSHVMKRFKLLWEMVSQIVSRILW